MAIMYPYYRTLSVYKLKLGSGDIRRIQALYN